MRNDTIELEHVSDYNAALIAAIFAGDQDGAAQIYPSENTAFVNRRLNDVDDGWWVFFGEGDQNLSLLRAYRTAFQNAAR